MNSVFKKTFEWYETLKERKIYFDPKKDVDDWFAREKDYIVDRLGKLPSDDLSIYAEPRLRKLYHETYFLVSLGMHNASIVMCGVLLEALLKEVIYNKAGKELSDIVGEKNANLGRAINFCYYKRYITENDQIWLKEVKDDIRNKYLHSNVGTISKGAVFEVWSIFHKTPEELLSILQDIRSGKIELPPPKLMTGDDLRVISDIAKGQIDEKRSLPFFLEVDKFVREIIKKHFEVKETKK